MCEADVLEHLVVFLSGGNRVEPLPLLTCETSTRERAAVLGVLHAYAL